MMGTGAHFSGIGTCPGCGKSIAGMIPQRCFFCGHDFTEDIQKQNPEFEPDPLYVTPTDPVREYTQNLEKTIESLGDDLFPHGPEGCLCTWGRNLDSGAIIHDVNPDCPVCATPSPLSDAPQAHELPAREYDVDSDAEEVDGET